MGPSLLRFSNGLGEAFDDIALSDGLLLEGWYIVSVLLWYSLIADQSSIVSEALFFVKICLTKYLMVVLRQRLLGIKMKRNISLCNAMATLFTLQGLDLSLWSQSAAVHSSRLGTEPPSVVMCCI